MNFTRTVKALALAGSFMFASGLASAATLTQQVPGNIFGTNGSATVQITSPQNVAAQAGGFALNGVITNDNDAENFTAWRLDISQSINLNVNYAVTSNPFTGAVLGAARIANIQALFNTALAGLNITNNANSAGFQLALWELAYENGSSFDVSSGNFKATSGNASALSVANSLLAGLGGPLTGNYSLTFLESKYHASQNLVTGTPGDLIPPVPVPAAGLLLFSALGGIGVLGRMRRRATA